MMALARTRRRRTGGFTLVEALVSSFIFIFLLAAVYESLSDSISFQGVQKTYAQMQMDARRALERMSSELRMAGRFSNPVPGQPAYPYIFTNGAAVGGFAALSHSAPVQHLAPGNPAFGDVREIAFKIPEDVDGDGLLTAEATGEIEWSTDIYSYVLVTDPNGINVLQRRSGTTVTDTIARYVERLTVNTIDTDPSIGLNEIVITIYMARPDNTGQWLQANLTGCVTMRNTEEVN